MARTVVPMAPFAEQLAEFKRRVAEGDCPNPDLPVMELWTDNSGVSKTHTFKPVSSACPRPVSSEAGADRPSLLPAAAGPENSGLGSFETAKPVPDYLDMKVSELRAEISRRNADRVEAEMIAVGPRARHAELVDALHQDDASGVLE